jgi:Family of unknown function (DUF6459)
MNAVTPIRSVRTDGIPAAAVRQVPLGTTPGAPGRPLKAVDEKSEVTVITRSTVQAAMEVLAGIRPVHQLARRLDPRCLAVLQHRAALIRREQARSTSPALGRLHKNSVVRSVRVCAVAAGVYEASAVVVDDVRARAVAVRLEQGNQVWRVTELVIG